jgi:hypothetical protein
VTETEARIGMVTYWFEKARESLDSASVASPGSAPTRRRLLIASDVELESSGGRNSENVPAERYPPFSGSQKRRNQPANGLNRRPR